MLRFASYVLVVVSCLAWSSISLATSSRQLSSQGEGIYGEWAHSFMNDSGGYMRPKFNSFLAAATHAATDKVTRHNYQTLYGKYFQRMGGRRHMKKMLEIGLGCNMDYGPGHSSRLWRKYFPQAEIWQADYDVQCVTKHKAILEALEINALTGDQANLTTLREWITVSGGNFDYIIEDGGHTSMQMFHTLIVMFEEALKPGGVFFLEDLTTQQHAEYVDGDKQHNMLDIIRDWVLLLITPGEDGSTRPMDRTGYAYKAKWPLPPGLKAIDCAQGMCAFTKCYEDDPQCPMTVMRKYQLNAAGVMAASWDDPALVKA